MKTIDIADEDVHDFWLVMECVRDTFDFSGDELAYNQEKIVNYVLKQLEPTPEETKEAIDYLNSEIKNIK
jgi:hypothetical protein